MNNIGTRKQMGTLSRTLLVVPTAPTRYPERRWVLGEVSETSLGVLEAKLG